MEKNQYDELILRIVFYENKDVIATSQDYYDDLGNWNDSWFA